ncbi:GNAT family N-acetyltransferase [Halioxenophilus sp. WMMB6]|uniref:GNAT family N-acetyltransferase n=1 Tax=Halioxenophilus sp. WMMB6 TaxID=3073815 RepID=UPI00295F4F74|nr:GNAT family N-acetyltransferase [Halioxenophilus sp. WMMB6]
MQIHSIRRYQPKDFPALVPMMAELQELERAQSGDRTRGEVMAEAHLHYLLQLSSSTGGATWVAENNKGVVQGFLVLAIESTDPGDEYLLERYRKVGNITDLFVLPAVRSQGVGRLLVNTAEDYCRGLGLARVVVSTLQSNQSAIAFYRQSAYQPHTLLLSKEL